MARKRSRSGLSDTRLAPPTKLAKYGLRDAAAGQCPIPPGSKRRIALCQQPGKPGKALNHPDDVCNFLRNIGSADRESFYAIHLDRRNRVIGVEEVAKGTIDAVITSPRETFKAAILNNAAAMIVAHNHPSGDPSPSDADIHLTQALAKAGVLLDVPLRDHVIVGSTGCHSLRMKGTPNVDWRGARRRKRR